MTNLNEDYSTHYFGDRCSNGHHEVIEQRVYWDECAGYWIKCACGAGFASGLRQDAQAEFDRHVKEEVS